MGEWTNNDLTVLGRGFSVDDSVYQYETLYPGNNTVYEKYYVMKGVGFYDKTARSWLSYNDTFTYTHTYVAYVYLKADDGYSFDTSSMTARINGKEASVIYDEKDPTKKLCITAEFYCDIIDVSLIMMYNVKTPVAGQTPADYTVTMAYPEYYTLDTNRTGYVNGIRWVDENGRDMRANSTFKEGVEYRVQIAVTSVVKHGKNVCDFTSPISAMMDGVMLESPGANGWDEVYWASSSLVYIYYTFPAAVAAPTPNEPERLAGDIDGDGKVNAFDANILSRIASGTCSVEKGSAAHKAADLNSDGKVNALDSNLFKRKMAGY